MVRKGMRIVLVLIVVAVLAIGGVLLVQRRKRALAAAPRYGTQPVAVSIATARRGDLQRMQEYLAVAEPIRVAQVSARLTATVEKVLHNENQPVKAGDVLAVLDGRQIADSIAAAKAQVAQAQADLAANQATVESLSRTCAYWQREQQRDRKLADKGVIPGSQAEGTADKANEAQGKLEAARKKSAALERQVEALQRQQAGLETTLSYCTIRSPFDGVVSHRLVDPGDLATPGKSLMTVEDRSRIKLCFDVPQQDLPQVREGLAVTFTVGGKTRTATLSHMFPSLNTARMLRAEVYLDPPAADGLSCGAYVPLRVVLGNRKGVTLVPSSSVVEAPGRKPYVFTVHGQRLDARPVQILGADGDDVAVDGVQTGEQVVLSTFLGWAQLSSGMKVEPVK